MYMCHHAMLELLETSSYWLLGWSNLLHQVPLSSTEELRLYGHGDIIWTDLPLPLFQSPSLSPSPPSLPSYLSPSPLSPFLSLPLSPLFPCLSLLSLSLL